MPWDASLNKDVHDAVARHVTATSHLEVGNPLRFSRATTKDQTNAYLRVLEGSPTSERICQDIERSMVGATEAIREKKGFWSEGYARGDGHRAKKRRGNHGGKRTKSTASSLEQWWSPGVKAVVDASIARSLEVYSGGGGGGGAAGATSNN